jgi:hypothetical protein
MIAKDELGRKLLRPILTYYPSICLKDLRKIMKTRSHGSRSPERVQTNGEEKISFVNNTSEKHANTGPKCGYVFN